MCKKRNSRKVAIQDRSFKVDSCLVVLITELNNLGIQTLACCCGHGHYKPTVIIKRDGHIVELFTGARIPRTRRFYRTDKDRLYFIPELQGDDGR